MSEPEKKSNDSGGSELEVEAQAPVKEEAPALGGERGIRGIKWALAVIAILSSTFLFALDTTVVGFGQSHHLKVHRLKLTPSAGCRYPAKYYQLFRRV